MKVNRIELDKTKGLTIQVLNGRAEQTIFLDGNKITITVKGPGGTSTIEQTPTTVTVTADNFIVNAKTITEVATVEATIRSGASSMVMSPAATAITATELAMVGTANANVTSPTVTVEAAAAMNVASTGIVSVEGSNINLTALTGVEVEAPNIMMVGAIEFIPIPV